MKVQVQLLQLQWTGSRCSWHIARTVTILWSWGMQLHVTSN